MTNRPSRLALLDTSIIVALLRNDPLIVARLPTYHIAISAIVVGELYFGAERSLDPVREAAKIRALSGDVQILSCDWTTGQQYGTIKNMLTRRGTLIPENDMWIAATALQHNLPLVSRDEHFRWIEGLAVDAVQDTAQGSLVTMQEFMQACAVRGAKDFL